MTKGSVRGETEIKPEDFKEDEMTKDGKASETNAVVYNQTKMHAFLTPTKPTDSRTPLKEGSVTFSHEIKCTGKQISEVGLKGTKAKGKKSSLKSREKCKGPAESVKTSRSKENVLEKKTVGENTSSAPRTDHIKSLSRLPLQDENSVPHHGVKSQEKNSLERSQKKDQEKENLGNDEVLEMKYEDLNNHQNKGTTPDALDITAQPHYEANSPHAVGEVIAGKTNVKQEEKKVKGKPSFQKKKLQSAGLRNWKVTDYYPVRRSFRKTKGELESDEKKRIDEFITRGKEEGLKVEITDGKGRGVIATKPFFRGDYIVEYNGELIEYLEAKKREKLYEQDPAAGCYMYYFQYLSKTYCIDATKETGRLGRLINHSKNGNCHTKLHDIRGVPHLILVASCDIREGEELLYDYGDRSKASLEAHPWLKN
ncbi:N-lysine methyltransferase KMT5A-A-like [Protopterus annectens]|uniref:N-lysine methyltransferase KMT5A-A-like n=1 Tax=Protopterus annectens TaxID=7888 RepID=UPI001CFB4C6C|nr:N-lysine methyltransferase KMT5A-A-like [Protopterus annectens]